MGGIQNLQHERFRWQMARLQDPQVDSNTLALNLTDIRTQVVGGAAPSKRCIDVIKGLVGSLRTTLEIKLLAISTLESALEAAERAEMDPWYLENAIAECRKQIPKIRGLSNSEFIEEETFHELTLEAAYPSVSQNLIEAYSSDPSVMVGSLSTTLPDCRVVAVGCDLECSDKTLSYFAQQLGNIIETSQIEAVLVLPNNRYESGQLGQMLTEAESNRSLPGAPFGSWIYLARKAQEIICERKRFQIIQVSDGPQNYKAPEELILRRTVSGVIQAAKHPRAKVLVLGGYQQMQKPLERGCFSTEHEDYFMEHLYPALQALSPNEQAPGVMHLLLSSFHGYGFAIPEGCASDFPHKRGALQVRDKALGNQDATLFSDGPKCLLKERLDGVLFFIA